MSARRAVVLGVLLVGGVGLCADGPAAPPPKRKVFEGYPAPLKARLEARSHRFQAAFPGAQPKLSASYILKQKGLWGPGAVVTVAFRGGTDALRKQIVAAAARWQEAGNFTYDFGLNPTTGKYREWTPNDTRYAARVRVSFDQDGYWSLVGTDSVDPSLVKAGEASLNLSQFDAALPEDWEAVVLHEFGHSLGFEHEHQSPAGGCEKEFRWEDDKGYQPTQDEYGQYVPDAQQRRPGIYTMLGGPPNNWPRSQVDFNLRKLPNSSMYLIGKYDNRSIMEYSFPDWMCRTAPNKCCVAENLTLSDGDKAAVARAYPGGEKESASLLEELRSVNTRISEIGDKLLFPDREGAKLRLNELK